jgi:hypothetical protein
MGCQLSQPARRISLRSASAFLNSTRTRAHASALHRVCSMTRRTRLMRSQGCQRASAAGLTSLPITSSRAMRSRRRGERRRAEVAPQFPADHSQVVQIAELDLPHILVKEDLDAVDDALALPRVRFPS